MKELSIEEKAKRYDEAIEKAKDMLSYKEVRREDMEYLFPELKESEGERIRKVLIDGFKRYDDRSLFNGCLVRDIVVWLEKQGEQKPVDFDLRTWKYIVDAVLTEKEGIGQYLDSPSTEEVAKKLQKRFGNIEQKPADNKGMNIDEESMTPFQKKVFCIIDTAIEEEQGLKQVCDELLALASNEIEQKPVVDDKDAEKASEEYRNFRMSCGIKDHVMLNEIEEAFYEGAIRKQKPVWSEEDKRNIERCITKIEIDKQNWEKNGNANTKTMVDADNELINWLKSIKDRVLPQPKQEWSEEDSPYYDDICEILINLLRSETANVNKTAVQKDLDWLKSLKYRYTWKPSDEQMQVLQWCMPLWSEPKTKAVLESLIADLKKLKA